MKYLLQMHRLGGRVEVHLSFLICCCVLLHSPSREREDIFTSQILEYQKTSKLDEIVNSIGLDSRIYAIKILKLCSEARGVK